VPATQPPVTQPPATQPPATQPPATAQVTEAPVATPAVTPGVTYPEAALKIGMLGNFTGQSGIYGQPAKNTSLLAIQDINAAGGIWGKPVQFAFGEGASNPQQGLSESQRLVNVEHSQVLVETGNSADCLAVKQGLTVPDKILTFGALCISPVHTSDQSNKEGFFFRVRPSVNGLMGPIAKLIADDGHKNICVMYVDNAYGQSARDSFHEIFTALVPDASLQEVGIPDAVATSYLSELQTCTENGHDIVATPAYGEGQADVFMKEGIENSLVKRFYFTEDQESTAIFEKDGWDAFDGMVGASGSGLPGPGLTYFRTAYTNLWGSPPDVPLTEENYDAVILAALAAAKANSDVSSDIRDSVYDVANAPGEKIGAGPEEMKKALDLIAAGQDIDYDGVTAHIEYDDQGQNLIGGARIWHVDAASKTLVTDYFLKFDAVTNEFTKIEATQ
jgi:branched-chain amino acid transport system substrate-binding protein